MADLWPLIFVPKEINYIWFGPTFNRFERLPIQDCLKKNPDHIVRVWVDDFSMLEMYGPHGLCSILSPSTFGAYEDGLGKAIKASEMAQTFEMLLNAQMEYQSYIDTHDVPPGFAPTVKTFRDYFAYKHLPIELRLLSSRFYKVELTALERGTPGPEIELLKWIFLERYRGNYGAASNLLRVQLLISWPGIYLDHDDVAPVFGQLAGFRYTRSADHNTTNCFLANPPNHPFLPFFRGLLIHAYKSLAERNFSCGQQEQQQNNYIHNNYTQLQMPTHPDDLDHPYITETQLLSGPLAFASALRQFCQQCPDMETGIRKGWTRNIGVKARLVKTWALSEEGFERFCGDVMGHIARPRPLPPSNLDANANLQWGDE